MYHVFNDRAKSCLPIEEMGTDAMVRVQRISAPPFTYNHLAVMPNRHPATAGPVGR